MRRLRKLIPLLLAAIVRPIGRIASTLVKKDKLTWIIGSWDGTRFADNSKWLFLWYHARPERLGPHSLTWISRSRRVVRSLRNAGLPAEWLWSLKGITLSLRAGLHILDADSRGIAPWSLSDAVSVNLFHGIALKHIGADIHIEGNIYSAAHHGSGLQRLAVRLLAPWIAEKYTAVIASSPGNAQVMRTAFPDSTYVFVCGLPRNDVLTARDDTLLGIHESGARGSSAATARTVVYMPTFRDFAREGRSIPLPWRGLEELLEEFDATLVLRLHPNDAATVPRLHAASRISVHPSAEDPYLLLRNADVLVTDYSSVMFDYVLTDRPIILYCYDRQEYLTRARGMYYALEDIAPGPLADDEDSLLRQLRFTLSGHDTGSSARREKVRRLLHTEHPEGSCAAVAVQIERLLTEVYQ